MRILSLTQALVMVMGLRGALLAQGNEGPQPAVNTGSATLTPTPPVAGRNWFRTLVHDERTIWLSPLHLKKQDAKWLLPFAASTAILIASDARIAEAVPREPGDIRTGQRLSRIGAAYTLFGAAGGAYLVGRFTKDDRLRETGRIGAEAVAHAFVVTHAIKFATGRQRPEDGKGRGQFFQGDVSFPSGHSMMAWSFASVIAHEYHGNKAVAAGAFAAALAVNTGRTMARKHFISDSMVGGVLGYFIGRSLYRQHHADSAGVNGRARASLWLPEIAPRVERASGTYGVALTWNLLRR